MAAFWRQNSSFYQKYLFHSLSFYNSHPDIKIYLELILSLLAVIILGVFAIKPTLTTIAELSAEVEQKEAVNLQLEEKISALSSAQQGLLQNQTTLDLLDTSVPTSPQVQDYIKQLEGMALENGVNITNLQLEKIALIGAPIQPEKAHTEAQDPDATESATLPQTVTEIPITVTVSGAYPQLMTFLQSIEDHRRPMVIDGIISNSSSTQEGSILQLNIVGRIPYYYIEKEVPVEAQ